MSLYGYKTSLERDLFCEIASQSRSKAEILDNTLTEGVNVLILETLFQSIGFCQIFNTNSSSYCKSALEDNNVQSHVIKDLSNVDNMLSLSKAMSFLPLRTFQSHLAISRERSSARDNFKPLLGDKAIQSQDLCFVFSNNSLSTTRQGPIERHSQSQSLS